MGEEGVVVNIDLSGVEDKLEALAAAMSKDEKQFVKELSAQLFANTNFDTGLSPYQIASNAISRALILVDSLKSKNLF